MIEEEADLQDIIWESLSNEKSLMEKRRKERRDFKFLVLESFLSEHDKQKGKSFEGLYNSLGDVEKHVIITRLQNQASHMGGRVPVSFINKLERDLYGVVIDENGDERINSFRISELEREAQEKQVIVEDY